VSEKSIDRLTLVIRLETAASSFCFKNVEIVKPLMLMMMIHGTEASLCRIIEIGLQI